LSTAYGSSNVLIITKFNQHARVCLILEVFQRIIYALIGILPFKTRGRVVKLADTTASKAVGFTSVGVVNSGFHVFLYRKKPLKDIRTAFKNSCKRAGIKNLRFHDLRHTFATRLVLAGVDLATVSKLLGHSSIQMTMRYAHPTPEALKSAVSKANKS